MGVKISTLLPQPAKVDTGAGTFEVTGLAIPAVVALIGKYRMDFARLLVLDKSGTPDYSGVLQIAPDMAVDIIAAGAGVDPADTEEIEAIKRLGAGAQLTALSEIWRLTVPEPKKLNSLLSVVKEQVQEVNRELSAGKGATSGTSVQQSAAL